MTVRLIEGEKPYTAGDGIDISTDKVISVLLREENNLIHLNSNNELYTDLQIVAGAKPTDDFEVGVTTGRVLESDGRPKTGTLLHYETTSGDYCQWLYGTDTNLYFDGGDGNRRQVYYADQVNEIFIRWMDFYFNTPTGNNITVGLSTAYTPTGDFTVNAPSDIKEGQTYLLRVSNGAIAHTMSLGNGITNLQGTDITLTPNAIDMFVFLATKDGNEPVKLELQKEISPSSGGGVYSFYLVDETSQTELDNLWSRFDSLPDEAFDGVVMIEHTSGVYFFTRQDSQDAYFFGDINMLRVQFQMEGWYTRTGVDSVTVEPLYTAGTGISISGNVISSTLTGVPSGGTNGQVLTKTSGGPAWQNAAGDVTGPSSATDGHLALFDGATGKLIKDGGVVPTGFNPANAGSANQLLVKTATGYQWKTGNVNSFPIPEVGDNMGYLIASAFLWDENITQVYAGELSSDCYIVTSYVHPSNATDGYGHIIGVGCANNSGGDYTIGDARVRRIDIAFNATTQLCISVNYTENIEPTVVSGDSGTTYTIKVSNSEPASGTPATTITFVS